MFASLRPPIVAALASLLFAIAPFISVAIASAIAAWAGCTLNEADVHRCVVCGVDIGHALGFMYVMGWCFFLTVPIGAALFVVSILWLVVAGGMCLADQVNGTAVSKSHASDAQSRAAERLAQFTREYEHLRKHITSMPEFRNVRLSSTRRRGGRVYMHGRVLDKEAHDRLMEAYKSLVHSNDAGCYDGVEYPGKPSEKQPDPPETTNAEPTDAADSP
jgi:hypothetical protein